MSIPKYTEKHQKLKLISSNALKEKMQLNKQQAAITTTGTAALNDSQQSIIIEGDEEEFKAAITQTQK